MLGDTTCINVVRYDALAFLYSLYDLDTDAYMEWKRLVQ